MTIITKTRLAAWFFSDLQWLSWRATEYPTTTVSIILSANSPPHALYST